MGQSWSSDDTNAEPSCKVATHKALRDIFSNFERLSVKQHMAGIGEDPDKLLQTLGIQDFPGASVILVMAQNLAEGSLFHHVLAVIGWFDGRLASSLALSDYEWQQKLFNSACSSEIGGEQFISYESLSNLVSLLISASTSHPENSASELVTPLQVAPLADQMLSSIKAPAIQFETFRNAVLNQFPYLFHSFAHIWDRLLYDEECKYPKGDNSMFKTAVLSRPDQAIIFCLLGPGIANAVRLYDGATNGFAMRALEHGVTKWPSPSMLVVKGTQPKTLQKSWGRKAELIDQTFPISYDVPLKPAKDLTFALYVDGPWKSSSKYCVGGRKCFIVQLEPELHVWNVPPKSVFLTPSKGFGAGLDHPPKSIERTREALLFVDDSMEHAIFRRISESGEKFEHRFYVKHVEVVGLGTKSDLEKQTRAWEWEEAESERRKNVNVNEDRAILELAGIVGQYNG